MVTRIADRGGRARRGAPHRAGRLRPRRCRRARPAASSGAAPDAAIAAVLLDLPLLRGRRARSCCGRPRPPRPGPAPLAVWRSVDGASFTLVASIATGGDRRALLRPLPPGPAGRFDRAGSLARRAGRDGRPRQPVRRPRCWTAPTRSPSAGPNGSFEVLQFATASACRARPSIACEGSCAASSAPRARRRRSRPAPTSCSSTRRSCRSPRRSTRSAGRSPGASGRPRSTWATRRSSSCRRSRRPRGAAALCAGPCQGVAHSGGRSPCPGSGARASAATRWLEGEVPLGEDREAYEVDILRPARPSGARSAARRPSVLYAAADELADFGAPQAASTSPSTR